TLQDLKGKPVSTSVGSAAHGTLVRALQGLGLKPTDVQVQNQQPSIGASALQAGSVAALSQFVAWPGQLIFNQQAKLIYDRSALQEDVPFLKSIGNLDDVDLNSFIDDGPLRRVYGPSYDADRDSTENRSRISGTDPVCNTIVGNPATAGETWFDGENATHPS